MTADGKVDWRDLEPGREMDALIQGRVFGHAITWLPTALAGRVPHYTDRNEGSGYRTVPSFSSDIAPAWRVVVKMRERWRAEGYGDEAMKRADPFWTFVDCAEDGWRVDITLGTDDGNSPVLWASSLTLPAAICRAALAYLDGGE